MATSCCNCGQPVENDTALTQAPACDSCQDRWRRQGLTVAVEKCLSNRLRVFDHTGTEITADDLDRVRVIEANGHDRQH